MAVYWSLAIIWPRLNAKVLLLASLGISVAVEFSQLLQWRWLVDLRQTTVGALLLGRGFLVADLFRYSAGSAIAFVLDVTGKWFFQGRARTDKRMAESEGDSGDRLA